MDEARTAVQQYRGIGGSAHLESLRRSYFEAMKTIGKLLEELSRAVRDASSKLEAEELMRGAVNMSRAILLQRERYDKMMSDMIGDWPY